MKVLAIDLNNILYRGLHVHKDLNSGPYQTGGLFGFINQFCHHIKTHKPDSIIVCTDSPPYIRSQLLPTYKEKAEPGSAEILNRRIAGENRIWIEELLHLMNIPVFGYKGLEADDCFGILCMEYSALNEIVVVSNDSDLFQLLSFKNVVLQRNKVAYTIENFKKDYPGVDVNHWARITSIAGNHNSVPGIRGYGMAKAIKLFYDKGKWFIFQQEHKEELDLYKKTVTIPIKWVKPPQLTRPKIIERKIISYLSSFRIAYTPGMHNALERFM